MGITDNFVRASVGIEDIDDLIEDLNYAFKEAGVVVEKNYVLRHASAEIEGFNQEDDHEKPLDEQGKRL